jgi:hypothetical protein
MKKQLRLSAFALACFLVNTQIGVTYAKGSQTKTIPAEFRGYWQSSDGAAPFLLDKNGKAMDDYCGGPIQSVTSTNKDNTKRIVVKSEGYKDMDCLHRSGISTDTYELKGGYLYQIDGKHRFGPFKIDPKNRFGPYAN